MTPIIINENERIANINLKKLIGINYKPSIRNQIRWFFESAMEVIIIILAIPFLTLIKIFQIIFNRK